MSDLPCIGFGITVVDPGTNANEAFTRGRNGRPYSPRKRPIWPAGRPSDLSKLRLLRAYVTEISAWNQHSGSAIQWKSGGRVGTVWEKDEMTTWTRGHGPQARAALMAARGLR